MTEITEITLGELAQSGLLQLGDGYRTKQSEHGVPGLPILRVAEVLDGEIAPKFEDYVSDTFRSVMGAKVSQPGDVVLTTKGTVGRVAIIPADAPAFVYSPQLCFFRITPESPVSAPYLYYWFKSEDFWHQAQYQKGQTDMADYINLADIRSLIVKLPPKKAREAATAILGALDDKIAVSHRIRSVAEQAGKAFFAAHFSEALRHVTMNSNLPAEWKVMTLGESVSVFETGTRPRGGVASYSTGIPSIGAESIQKLGCFDFSKLKYIPEQYFASMRRGILRSHDILVYKDGGRPGEFEPHVSMFGNGFPFDQMCINEHVYRLRMSRPLSQTFGYFWLASGPLMNEMRIRGTGVAIPGLNSTAAREIPVVHPPVDRLERFDALAAPLVDKALNASQEAHLLAQLRDTLLPKLMSGELRVRDAEKVVEEVT
ncbi:MAG: restriction endonuclease subunit S [Gammaproteobacteria bacterium]